VAEDFNGKVLVIYGGNLISICNYMKLKVLESKAYFGTLDYYQVSLTLLISDHFSVLSYYNAINYF
jgi:hypothetical protein